MQVRKKLVDLRSFPPIEGSNATRLVLGSMPGAASLQAQEYYAHPRNAFWMIVESLFGIARAQPYFKRVRALEATGVAVWDVLMACRRPGSLDSAIETDSIVANDIQHLLQRNPGISRIYFNGAVARRLYDRHVLATMPEQMRSIPLATLPSTSPAHASLSLKDKTRAWSVISLP
jgi:hypoxanthine-DNA glycosylase